MPFGLSADFVKNNTMKIKVNDCCIRNAKCLSKGNLEINMLKILELQQKLVPIFLKTSGFNGTVYMKTWGVEKVGIQTKFYADFETTTQCKPFDEIDSVGTPVYVGKV